MIATRRWLLGGIAAALTRPQIVLGESLEWAAAFIRRSDYDAFLVRHGGNIDALIDALRQQVA